MLRAGRDSNPNRQIRRRPLCVYRMTSGDVWAAQVAGQVSTSTRFYLVLTGGLTSGLTPGLHYLRVAPGARTQSVGQFSHRVLGRVVRSTEDDPIVAAS